MYFADKEQAPQIARCFGNEGGVEDIACGKEQFAANDLFVCSFEAVDDNAVDARRIILGVRISGYGQKYRKQKDRTEATGARHRLGSGCKLAAILTDTVLVCQTTV